MVLDCVCDRANANLSKRKSSIALIFYCKYVTVLQISTIIL